jgi:hypothetical protein
MPPIAARSAWSPIARPRHAAALALGALLAGCGPTQSRTELETSAVGLPKPAAVYVYNFAVDPSEVKLDPGGPLSRRLDMIYGEQTPQDEKILSLGRMVSNRIAADLVEKINAMGLTAQRGEPGSVLPANAIAVTGQFADIDEGNKLRRLAIGFHQGQSRVGANVQVVHRGSSGNTVPLLEFIAAAESAPLPGAAVTMGAGAGVQVAAASSGAKSLGDSVQSDANRLATRIATQLQQFFAKQGWTAPPSTAAEIETVR